MTDATGCGEKAAKRGIMGAEGFCGMVVVGVTAGSIFFALTGLNVEHRSNDRQHEQSRVHRRQIDEMAHANRMDIDRLKHEVDRLKHEVECLWDSLPE